MTKTAGYFLIIQSDRQEAFEEREDEHTTRNADFFAEAVKDFSHSRNVPLITFILNDDELITHVGFGRRGMKAATGLRRLNVDKIITLKSPTRVGEVITATKSAVRHILTAKVQGGGLIPPKSFEEFLEAFLNKVPALRGALEKYSRDRRLKIEGLSDHVKKSLAEQKEAILTALNIAGIEKSVVQGWDFSSDKGPDSFLEGLEQVRLREDPMIINDLQNFPGYQAIKNSKYSSTIFRNDETTLKVVLANRLPLEEQTGTDLIYFNENFNCFIMVQYKVMERVRKVGEDQFAFRIPNAQLEIEIERMDSITELLNPIKSTGSLIDYRISNQPFFIKLCPRIDFEPDDVGLSNGMYMPLEYFRILKLDDSIKGEKGGMAISYGNAGRYLYNTTFKAIIESGWIGTHVQQSNVLATLIDQILETGKAVVLGLKKSERRSQHTPEDVFPNDSDDWDFLDIPE
jgi:hypothetical protein